MSAKAHNDALAAEFFENGEQISGSITVQKPAKEIYGEWAGLSGLPKFVEGVVGVGMGTDRTVEVRAGGGADPSWSATLRAEILNEEPDHLIAWRSTGEPEVPHAGSVTLRELPFGRGTEVRVVIDYIPPKGAVRQRLDKALGRDPAEFLALSLFRFRQVMEAGELATTKGQPAGRGDGRDVQGSRDEKKFAKAGGRS